MSKRRKQAMSRSKRLKLNRVLDRRHEADQRLLAQLAKERIEDYESRRNREPDMLIFCGDEYALLELSEVNELKVLLAAAKLGGRSG